MKINNLCKSYGDKLILNDISFETAPNELLVIIGESGCGKSTLIKCINHLHSFDSGTIEVPTKNKLYVIPSGDSRYDDDISIKRDIGYIAQNAGLLPHLTAWQNIKLPSEVSETEFDEAYANELMNKIHISDELLNKRPCQLSGGERQRIGIIRALVQKPDLLLLDEPFSALDPLVRSNLQRELIELKGTTTMIMVTHDMTEAGILADRLVLLHNGVIEQIGTPTELKLNPVSEYVANYMGNTKSVKLYYKSWRSAALDVMDDNHVSSVELIDKEGTVFKSITRAQVMKSLEEHPNNLESLLYV